MLDIVIVLTRRDVHLHSQLCSPKKSCKFHLIIQVLVNGLLEPMCQLARAAGSSSLLVRPPPHELCNPLLCHFCSSYAFLFVQFYILVFFYPVTWKHIAHAWCPNSTILFQFRVHVFPRDMVIDTKV